MTERDQARNRLAELELEVAGLRRRMLMDSTNSSTPPSKELVGARERRKAERLLPTVPTVPTVPTGKK
ncbi:hypothetical protein [Frankia sp. CiP3]|uniref:hypothetical protein n=1 Tax=Frankia sp. CiP3 TaxID=2880971 RepID=UPI001EF549F2|nr:hypothetical protein [Frankia sp. CiP3]